MPAFGYTCTAQECGLCLGAPSSQQVWVQSISNPTPKSSGGAIFWISGLKFCLPRVWTRFSELVYSGRENRPKVDWKTSAESTPTRAVRRLEQMEGGLSPLQYFIMVAIALALSTHHEQPKAHYRLPTRNEDQVSL